MPRKKISFMLTLVFVLSLSTQAFGATNTQIDKNNSMINELNQDKSDLENEKQQVNEDILIILNDIQSKETEINAVQEDIDNLQSQINQLQDDIDNTTSNILKAEEEIKEIEDEYIEKEKEQKEKEDLLQKRLRRNYINNTYNEFLGVIVDSSSISEMLSKVKYVTDIIQTDNDAIHYLKDLKTDLKKSEEKLNKDKKSLSDHENTLKFQQKNIKEKQDLIIAQKNKLDSEYQDLENLENQKQQTINDINKKQSDIMNQISDIMDINEQLENQTEGIANSDGYSNPTHKSQFISPIQGRLTCAYGPRIHPITNQAGMHTGIDLANVSGTPIKASDDGKIIMAKYYGAYGNCIIIDHGNGFSTLYGHQSAFAVKLGDYVTKGQTIGYVGSTGWSTGPHLHFEIRINGKHVNPKNYI